MCRLYMHGNNSIQVYISKRLNVLAAGEEKDLVSDIHTEHKEDYSDRKGSGVVFSWVC